MSRSPYFFVEKFDSHTKKYELQHPLVWNYDHTERKLADLFPYNGCHDLFSIVENNGTGNDFDRVMSTYKQDIREVNVGKINDKYFN